MIRSAAEMDASCAVSQGVACGLTGGDADTLNVEHELSRWLRDLDSSVSRPSGFPLILPWVAGLLHTEISVRHRKLNPDTVAHLSTNRARRRLTSLMEANALTTTPDHLCRVGHKFVSRLPSVLSSHAFCRLYCVKPAGPPIV